MFVKPTKSLKLSTTKGEIEISSSEFFIFKDRDNREPLVINKEGTQKIEDFFDACTEITGEGAILDNVYVKVRMTTPEGLKVERIGSANHRSLSNDIARAYAVEMAFKRACATAALEVLRKNYKGKEPLPLLYSSFDEFKTEDSVNQSIPVVEEKTPEVPATETKNSDMVEADGTAVEENPFAGNNTENKAEESSSEKPVEAEKSAEEKPTEGNNDEVITSNLGAFIIKSNKYRNGVTLQELAEKDINYLNWLVKGDNMKGRYKEYQETARKFVEEAGITLPA